MKKEEEGVSLPDGEDDDDSKTSHRKPYRSRKKKIYTDITRQMEFYFGDANLSKSKFMKELLKESPWVDLKVFLAFNKLHAMLISFLKTDDPETLERGLARALRKIGSESVELNEAESQVRRIKPFNGPRADVEECTIYVENVPLHSTPDSIRNVFTQYGAVAYVSLPKYKKEDIPKGFAFVEFQSSESAAKALEAYCFREEDASQKNPEELQTIKSFKIEQTVEVASDSIDPPPSKRVKIEQEPVEEEESTTQKSGDENPEKSKKKRKRLRKDNLESEEDLQIMTLRVMSKASWRKLRNKYLNLQRKNASLSKQRIREWKEKDYEKSSRSNKSPPRKVVKKEEEEEEEKSSPKDKTKGSEIEFVPNVIVKVSVGEQIGDPKTYKRKILENLPDPVQYVDIRIGSSEFHVRCISDEQAFRLATLVEELTLPGSEPPELSVLSGEEEVSYWNKIKSDREEKLSGKLKTASKKRGKTKIREKMDNAQNTRKVFAD